LRSAWIPAPPPESDPAIVSALRTDFMDAISIKAWSRIRLLKKPESRPRFEIAGSRRG
jgi:hypothetical protein